MRYIVQFREGKDSEFDHEVNSMEFNSIELALAAIEANIRESVYVFDDIRLLTVVELDMQPRVFVIP